MRHVWKGQQMGGHPADAGSTEWIAYCDNCGVEANGDNEDGECVLLPEVGETILYALEKGNVAPAVVTKVHDDGLTVNLRVLLDVMVFQMPDGVPEYWTREFLVSTAYCPPEYAVKYDGKGEGGTWRRELHPAPILPPYEG